MISAVNNCTQRWETKAASWSHENEGKKTSLFLLSTDASARKKNWKSIPRLRTSIKNLIMINALQLAV